MNKLTISIISIILMALIVGCTPNNNPDKVSEVPNKLPEEPPEISISIGDKNIQYVIGKNIWNGAIYDREDTFQTILREGSGIEVHNIKIGEVAEVRFTDYPPDDFKVYDYLIDEKGSQIYTDKEITEVPIEFKDGKYSFEISKHMASYLSSTYVEDKVELRGFRMIATWGENECEYGFVIKTESNSTITEISPEEMQKVDLYTKAMKAAFLVENGGNSFIAIKLDTLEGLSDKGKLEVINNLKSLSPNVYDFEDIKEDSTKFELDSNGNLVRSIDGSLLWVDVEEYNEEKAIITGVSWFGNLGAVFPTYEATYINGAWKLELISMAVS